MTGMTGIVSWNPGSQSLLESALPEPGKYFRGERQFTTLADSGAVQVFASAQNGLIAQHDRYTLAMLGSQSPQFQDVANFTEAFTDEPDRTLREIGNQFAFFYADRGQRRAFVAADAFGSYPIYYACVNNTLFVSTDLESLSRHSSLDTQLSDQAIYDYLYFSFIPAPSTVYKNIHRIPLGHVLVFDRDQCECHQWYRPASLISAPHDSPETSLRNSLADAVESRWTKSGSACFLSGGLDSSTICGLASQVSKSRVPAYSIGFPENEYDEMPYARIAATRFGLDHREHYVSATEIYANTSKVLNAVGEPFSNASSISSFVCAKKAVDDGYTNILAGDGGDELFAGNEVYSKQMQLHTFDRLPVLIRSLLISLNARVGNSPSGVLGKMSSYIRQASLPFSRRRQFYGFIEQTGYQEIFSRRFLNKVDPAHPVDTIQALFDSAPFDSFLQRMMYVDWRLVLADNDLRKVRIACDIAGADVQFPMLDSRVVSVAERMPGPTMMPRGRLRGFYKNSFKELLPNSILTKQKHGFGVPVGKWMQSDQEFKRFVDTSLASLAERDILNSDFLTATRLAHEDDNAVHYGVILWTLIVLETWLKNKNL